MKKISFCLASIASTVLAAPFLSVHAASNADLSLSVGGEYSTGDYGTSSTTNIWYVPFTLQYENNVNMVSLTVPYIRIEGKGTVVPVGTGGMGVGMTGMGGMGGASAGGMGMGGGAQAFRRGTALVSSQTESGLGDLVLTGSHKIAETDSVRVDLAGKIKFGTADDTKNLGTGKDDFAMELNLTKDYDNNSVYGGLGYEVLGSPAGTSLNNVFYGSLGMTHTLDTARAVGLELSAQQAASSGGSEGSDLTLYLSNEMDKKTKLTGYVLKGLSNGSPDWGIGVTLVLKQ